MDKSREELEKEYTEATAKLERYQHRGQEEEAEPPPYHPWRKCGKRSPGGARHEPSGL